MNNIQPSPKRAEAARYQKIADDLMAAALAEEAEELKEAQDEVQQKISQNQTAVSSSQTAEEVQQQGGDSTGSTFLDQVFGRNGR